MQRTALRAAADAWRWAAMVRRVLTIVRAGEANMLAPRVVTAFTILMILVSWTPALAEAPPIQAELHIDIIGVILEGWTRSFSMYYNLGTPLTSAEFEAHFPEDSLGGVRSSCGLRSLGGIRIDLAEPVAWKLAYVLEGHHGTFIGPAELVSLVLEEVEVATVDHIVFHDLAVESTTAFSGDRKTSATFNIEAERFRGPPVSWVATISFESYCEYRDSDSGSLVGTLTSADLGAVPHTVTLEGDDLPKYGYSTANVSWSSIKGRF